MRLIHQDVPIHSKFAELKDIVVCSYLYKLQKYLITTFLVMMSQIF